MTTFPLRRLGAAAAAALAAFVAGAAPAAPVPAQEPEDPALDQTIDRGQAVATGETVLADGHVDIGPHLVDESFTLMVHDDAVIPSVWRSLEETVLVVGDDARQTVPDDPTYEFLGVDPGSEVYVVPQVQQPGVVWVGWNTQDPEVMERIDRGATLTLLGVEGPGEMVVYLQAGNLTEPDVLWLSPTEERQPLWVEVNTHTHANWVFTEPGVYLVQVEVSAELVGSEPVSDVQTLRFAVGDATRPEQAFAAEYTRPLPPDDDSANSGGDSSDGDGAAGHGGGGDGGGLAPLVAGVAGGALVLGGGVAAVLVRGARAKRRADRERAAAAAAPGGSS